MSPDLFGVFYFPKYLCILYNIMKNKFWKISSMIMAPLSVMMAIMSAAAQNWVGMLAWIIVSGIWILNVKLYWSE